DIDHVQSLVALQYQFFTAEIETRELWVAPTAANPRGVFSTDTLTSSDTGERREKTERAARHLNLAFVTDGNWDDLQGRWPVAEMKGLLASHEKSGIFLGLRYQNGHGHAVACYKSHGSFVGGSHTYFYDPNFGEFSCKFDDTMMMLRALEELHTRKNHLAGRIHWHVFSLFDSSKRKQK
ncbi:MAG: YopT-type cysteine protease domain-containing protein, partial [Geminicoccaceae bacterium]